MFYFPGSVYYPESQAHTDRLYDWTERKITRFVQKLKNDSQFALFVSGILSTMISFIFLLVVMLGNAPPNLAKAVYLIKYDFASIDTKQNIVPSHSKQESSPLSKVGLADYYAVGITGYCSQFECRSFSPFYTNIKKIIVDNLEQGWAVRVPLDITDKDGLMGRAGQATWVFGVITIILLGGAFLFSSVAFVNDTVCLYTALLTSVVCVLMVVLCCLATATSVIYANAFSDVVDSYHMELNIGRLGFALLYLALCFSGIAVASWWMMVRGNNQVHPPPGRDIEQQAQPTVERRQNTQQRQSSAASNSVAEVLLAAASGITRSNSTTGNSGAQAAQAAPNMSTNISNSTSPQMKERSKTPQLHQPRNNQQFVTPPQSPPAILRPPTPPTQTPSPKRKMSIKPHLPISPRTPPSPSSSSPSSRQKKQKQKEKEKQQKQKQENQQEDQDGRPLSVVVEEQEQGPTMIHNGRVLDDEEYLQPAKPPFDKQLQRQSPPRPSQQKK